MSTRLLEVALRDLPPEPGARVAPTLGIGAAFAMAAAIALALSLQFAAQPFIWRNWPLDEILVGWLYVLRNDLLAAFLITPPVLWAMRLPARAVAAKLALVGLGAAAGAGIGEAVASRLDDGILSVGYLVAQGVRWAVVVMVVAAVMMLWQRRRAERERLRRETLRTARLDEQLTRAHLASLQSQIEPHFLFNTLGTVRHLHRVDPNSGVQLLDTFLDYLNAMLRMNDRATVTLGEEIALVASFLAIVRVRMRDRLAVVIDVPDDLRTVPVPPWAVSTLVENAVKHGIAPLERGGRIRISATRRDGRVAIVVADDGRGLGTSSSGGSGIGLSNVRARLAALFGGRASLVVENAPAGGVVAMLSLPAASPAP